MKKIACFLAALLVIVWFNECYAEIGKYLKEKELSVGGLIAFSKEYVFSKDKIREMERVWNVCKIKYENDERIKKGKFIPMEVIDCWAEYYRKDAENCFDNNDLPAYKLLVAPIFSRLDDEFYGWRNSPQLNELLRRWAKAQRWIKKDWAVKDLRSFVLERKDGMEVFLRVGAPDEIEEYYIDEKGRWVGGSMPVWRSFNNALTEGGATNSVFFGKKLKVVDFFYCSGSSEEIAPGGVGYIITFAEKSASLGDGRGPLELTADSRLTLMQMSGFSIPEIVRSGKY